MSSVSPTRPLILGTAGHIDHGKTSLIRALTGIDADRLPEEQARGMTIDLGFAFTEIGGRRLGIVDVPGHERFIRNMVAGATGIDLVLLVVAADDAVMPQTREHLEIIELLGVRGGVIVLNKIDLVDEHRLEQARASIRSLVRRTCLEDAAIVPVSATTGAGLEALRDAIAAKLASMTWAPWPALFRLPIDRRFSMQGHGTVVTGSLMGGDIRAGDEIELWPRGKKVRARAVQSHGNRHEGLESGRRVAVNLPNVKVSEIRRGDELAAAGYLRPSERLAVRLRCLESSPMIVAPSEEFRLHLGTASLNARFALLGTQELEPGQTCFALMQTDEPVCATHGQCFIFRSSAHGVTIGGGSVLATRPPHLNLKGEAPGWLADLASGEEERVVMAALEIEPQLGGSLPALCRETGLDPEPAAARLQALVAAGRILRSPGSKHPGFWTQSHVEFSKTEVVKRLRRLLEENRPRLAVVPGHLTQAAADLGDAEFLQWILGLLGSEGRISQGRTGIGLAGYSVELSDAEQRDVQSLLDVCRRAGLNPEGPAETAARAGLTAARAEPLREYAVDRGDLVELNAELCLHREVHEQLLESLRGYFADGKGLTVSELKDRLGITRKYAIPLCEHLDRTGFTRREGDLRFEGPRLNGPLGKSREP